MRTAPHEPVINFGCGGLMGEMARPGRVVCSDLRFPLICIEFHGAVDDPEWEAYLAKVQAIEEGAFKRGEKVALVVDTTMSTRAATARQRKLQAEQLLRVPPGVVLGMGAVIDNILIRGAMTALLWVQPLPFPHVIVGTRSEAEAWALELLEKHTLASAASRR